MNYFYYILLHYSTILSFTTRNWLSHSLLDLDTERNVTQQASKQPNKQPNKQGSKPLSRRTKQQTPKDGWKEGDRPRSQRPLKYETN